MVTAPIPSVSATSIAARSTRSRLSGARAFCRAPAGVRGVLWLWLLTALRCMATVASQAYSVNPKRAREPKWETGRDDKDSGRPDLAGSHRGERNRAEGHHEGHPPGRRGPGGR